MLTVRLALSACLTIIFILAAGAVSYAAPAADSPASFPSTRYGHHNYVVAPDEQLRSVRDYPEIRLMPAAAKALEEMIRDARAAGIKLVPASGFRAHARQQTIFDQAVDNYGSEEQAARWAAPPGYSEHHTGFALDFGDMSIGGRETRAYQWLTTNAGSFGFELSFPGGGAVSFEPWHWRYVGDAESRKVFRSQGPQALFAAPTTHADSADGHRELKLFGHNILNQNPSTFVPVDNLPVGSHYVIGPGDEIRIGVWGAVEYQWQVAVDRDGTINVPKLGALGVAGLSFEQLKDLLHREVSKYYTGFEMNVSMGALRTVQVYVVGFARQPGSYTVSSLSTLVNALFESGGPSESGTMRDIQLKRNGKTMVHFDLYDFLLKGDKTKDMRLLPEDVIHFPAAGSVVGITGEVENPALYELKGEVKIADLLQMAGGVTAAGQRVQVERVTEHGVQLLVDSTLNDLLRGEDVILEDGDMIKVSPVVDRLVNVIHLTGNVSKPGRYRWRPGLRVSDLLSAPDEDLLPETHFDYAMIERHVPPYFHREVRFFDLGAAVLRREMEQNLELLPHDKIQIFSRWELESKPMVRISGVVNNPGQFELRQNMTVADLVRLAGGAKHHALLDEVEITRIRVTNEGPVTEKLMVNLRRALTGIPENDISLLDNDYVVVRAVPNWRVHKRVTIAGEVRYPGTYPISDGERLSTLIERAGGFTDKAYLRGAVFVRQRIKTLVQEEIDDIAARLEQELLGKGVADTATALTGEEARIRGVETQMQRELIDKLRKSRAHGRMTIVLDDPEALRQSRFNIELEDEDHLTVPSNPESVQVIGAVYNQTAFVYDASKRFDNYIEMAGGYTQNADKKRAYLLKVDGTAERASNQSLEPGDTLVVPEKLDNVAWLRRTKDISQILFQLAATAAVFIAVL
jgi:protein involved in polysaccharide export with SLBB domain